MGKKREEEDQRERKGQKETAKRESKIRRKEENLRVSAVKTC